MAFWNKKNASAKAKLDPNVHVDYQGKVDPFASPSQTYSANDPLANEVRTGGGPQGNRKPIPVVDDGPQPFAGRYDLGKDAKLANPSGPDLLNKVQSTNDPLNLPPAQTKTFPDGSSLSYRPGAGGYNGEPSWIKPVPGAGSVTQNGDLTGGAEPINFVNMPDGIGRGLYPGQSSGDRTGGGNSVSKAQTQGIQADAPVITPVSITPTGAPAWPEGDNRLNNSTSVSKSVKGNAGYWTDERIKGAKAFMPSPQNPIPVSDKNTALGFIPGLESPGNPGSGAIGPPGSDPGTKNHNYRVDKLPAGLSQQEFEDKIKAAGGKVEIYEQQSYPPVQVISVQFKGSVSAVADFEKVMSGMGVSFNLIPTVSGGNTAISNDGQTFSIAGTSGGQASPGNTGKPNPEPGSGLTVGPPTMDEIQKKFKEGIGLYIKLPNGNIQPAYGPGPVGLGKDSDYFWQPIPPGTSYPNPSYAYVSPTVVIEPGKASQIIIPDLLRNDGPPAVQQKSPRVSDPYNAIFSPKPGYKPPAYDVPTPGGGSGIDPVAKTVANFNKNSKPLDRFADNPAFDNKTVGGGVSPGKTVPQGTTGNLDGGLSDLTGKRGNNVLGRTGDFDGGNDFFQGTTPGDNHTGL